MGILAKILGIGPLFFGALILVVLAVIGVSPQLAPLLPYMAILFPALVFAMLAWRRAYPSAISYLRKGVPSTVFWHAVAGDIPACEAGGSHFTLRGQGKGEGVRRKGPEGSRRYEEL